MKFGFSASLLIGDYLFKCGLKDRIFRGEVLRFRPHVSKKEAIFLVRKG
jgi:hypothetical protein